MNKITTSVLIALLSLGLAPTGFAQARSTRATGQQKSAPRQSTNDRTQKPRTPCRYVCVQYNRDGACVKQEYRCP